MLKQTGFSPLELASGHSADDTAVIDSAIDLPQLRSRVTNLQAIRSVLHEFDKQDQRNRAARSLISINPDFVVGDTVLLFNNSRRGKFTAKWKGVYDPKIDRHQAAVIRHITANDTQVVTVQRLKKYYKRNQAQSPVAALPAAIPIVVPPAPLAPAPPVVAPAAVAPAHIEAVPAPAVPDPVVAAPVPAPIEPVGHINGQPLWTVDAIVNHRTNHRRVVVQYQVRWSDNSTTWEPAQQVAEDVPTMVRQYRRRHRL
jgi:Chromo (CHRromatin Organisation MOdifier) domain